MGGAEPIHGCACACTCWGVGHRVCTLHAEQVCTPGTDLGRETQVCQKQPALFLSLDRSSGLVLRPPLAAWQETGSQQVSSR